MSKHNDGGAAVSDSELVNGLRHLSDDHPCCKETISMTIDQLEQLERENAALRGALKEFRDIAFIGMVAPVPDVRPYYSLVKKHSALLKNELKKEAQP